MPLSDGRAEGSHFFWFNILRLWKYGHPSNVLSSFHLHHIFKDEYMTELSYLERIRHIFMERLRKNGGRVYNNMTHLERKVMKNDRRDQD
ncbi:hypothetical protein D3Z50_09375 [Clostridiaceae bacterium]|nr:hypothetical protein [Clostridiaceae bacterium]